MLEFVVVASSITLFLGAIIHIIIVVDVWRWASEVIWGDYATCKLRGLVVMSLYFPDGHGCYFPWPLIIFDLDSFMRVYFVCLLPSPFMPGGIWSWLFLFATWFFKSLAFKGLNMWRQFCCSGDKDCEHLTKYINFEHAYCLAVKHLGVHCAVLPVSLAMIRLLYLSVKGAFGGVC